MVKYNHLNNVSNLSIKYNNYWNSKPLWCKPWSIILTGIIITCLAWYFIHIILIDIIISSLVCFWWILFLLIAPISFSYELGDLNSYND